VRKQLFEGRLIVYFEPKEGHVAVGDRFTVTMGLQDSAMPHAVQDTIDVKITQREKVTPKPPKPPRPPKPDRPPESGNSGEKKGDDERAAVLALPPCKLLTKDGRPIKGYDVEPWPPNIDGFDEQDGGLIEDLGAGKTIYKINYDNSYHLKYKRTAGSNIAKEVVSKKYIMGMRVLMMGYEHALRALGKDGNVATFSDEFRRMAARGSASTVLSLAEKLPKIVDETAIPTEVVE
jgi:hypothetical protein